MRPQSLKKLIDHQEKLLKEARARLAKENAKLCHCQEKINHLLEHGEKQNQLFFSAPVFALVTYQNFLEKNKLTLNSLSKELEEVEKKVEGIKAEIRSIFRDMKGISIVRDRLLTAARKKAEKKEQQLMEESFLMREFRGSLESALQFCGELPDGTSQKRLA